MSDQVTILPERRRGLTMEEIREWATQKESFPVRAVLESAEVAPNPPVSTVVEKEN